MDNQKKQVEDKLKAAKNVLVTVSTNPSVDQLSACLGLTLMLNKLGKHASAVFSGDIPSTIEFLKPEETLETNTNSLRDFIIALDRNKADKLRYKVEDRVVRIFITPYKTSISQDDLQFSEGDFNVDVVMALGVKDQADIDQAVTAHGNILHDATVVTVSTSDESALGAIHWRDPSASGVSELAASLAEDFDKNVLDEQIATAFLTGIVAQTERFSNNLTSSTTMTISAKLMAAGANQQLVAEKLEEPAPAPEPAEPEVPDELPPLADEEAEAPATEPVPESEPGLLEIDHSKPAVEDEPTGAQTEENAASEPPDSSESSSTDEANSESKMTGSRGEILDGDGPDENKLTASDQDEKLDPTTDPFSLPPLDQKILKRDNQPSDKPAAPALLEETAEATPAPTPPEPAEPVKAPESLESKEGDKPAAPAPPEVEPPAPEAPLGGENPQTIEQIEAEIHPRHLLADDSKNGATPGPEPHSSEIHIDENGSLLIGHNPSSPTPDGLRPAPGFDSEAPSGTPDPAVPGNDITTESNSDAPPFPPPMV